MAGRRRFTRDAWLDAVLRSVGLEPGRLTQRLKFHFIARLAPLVEPNYNLIELGPRGTGKSYFFSEFSPYATLVSGGQASKASLFYNNARRRIGLVGFWDTVAFDEVAGIRINDPDTIQIMKDFMANGRFSRGVEVIADASLAFVGNIDHSIDQLVNSAEHDLFVSLPKEFDLAIMDRFALYLPGWEMLKNSSEYLTSNYGFITDYLAEAFHHQFAHSNRYEEVTSRIRLGAAVEGRDERSIKKTVGAFLKILHPDGPPTSAEFEEYVAYAVEGRRRVKEQMNKRKPDEEFARIDLSYHATDGREVVVYCLESEHARATQQPLRRALAGAGGVTQKRPGGALAGDALRPPEAAAGQGAAPVGPAPGPAPAAQAQQAAPVLKEQHFTIHYDATGYSYESIVAPYLAGARAVVVEDPYIRLGHQIQNFVRFCEVVVKHAAVRRIQLITGDVEDPVLFAEMQARLGDLRQSLLEHDVELDVELDGALHDREIRIDNDWVVKIGRGLDFYQKPESWYELGANDMALRKCLETKVDIFRAER